MNQYASTSKNNPMISRMENRVVRIVKLIDFRLYGSLLLMGFIPTIYTSFRIFLLGYIPTDSGINIASQIIWLGIFFEVFQEALILPLFFIMGKSLKSKNEFENKIQSGFIVTFLSYSFFSLFIVLFAKPMVTYMSQNKLLIDDTIRYIRLETLGLSLGTIVQYFTLLLITIGKVKYLLRFLGIQLLLTTITDTFLVSTLSVSLNIGVIGIAITNIIVNLVMIFITMHFLSKQGLQLFKISNISFGWTKEWFRVSSFSGMESLVRNFVFTFVIVRLMNLVEGQGIFWVTNSFIWGWLLLPIIQFGQIIRRECGIYGFAAIEKKVSGYFILGTLLIILWFMSIPLWKPFLKHILNVSDYQLVFKIVALSMPFYCLFVFNIILDSIFYGLGKTDYLLIQSIVINLLLYGTLFYLYKIGIFTPTIISMSIIFAIGIAADSIFTFGQFLFMLKKHGIKLIRINNTST